MPVEPNPSAKTTTAAPPESPRAASGQVERAAGGLVWRQVPTGPEVILVHRPAYDDWAFPKGKLKAGESDEHGALREVKEESGLTCRLGPELPSTTYPLEGGVKTVRYWAMTVAPPLAMPVEPAPSPEGAKEVDQARWATLARARQLLSYARDVVVLDALHQLAPLAGYSEVRRHQDDGVLEEEPQGE